MKKYAVMTALLLAALVIPGASWAQSAPGGIGSGAPQGAPGGGQHPNGQQGGQGGGDGKEFQERKAEILNHMREHEEEIHKRMACVEAANDHEALRACVPEHGEGQGQGHGGPRQGQR